MEARHLGLSIGRKPCLSMSRIVTGRLLLRWHPFHALPETELKRADTEVLRPFS
jgi:hypothetical protein